MKSLEIARTLESSFAHRDAFRLSRKRSVERLTHGDRSAFIVLDLSLSRELLTAKALSSYNYFSEGIKRLECKGGSMQFLRQFLDEGLLFMEGTDRRCAKPEHMRLLDLQCENLIELRPRIVSFFEKRNTAITDALTFSRLFVRLCMGISISSLTSARLRASMRAIQRRDNIFYYHFHPSRHQRMEAVLSKLSDSIPGGRKRCGDTAWLLAISLIVMGYDPLVGALCAALVDGECEDLSRAPDRYCPTSFVSRICVQETKIAGQRLTPGDICYLSLVPDRDDAGEQATFPFGLGVHTCAGKRFSGFALELAREVVGHCFPQGFRKGPLPYGDGAFLCFRNP